jgi:hypothetical protein
MAHATASREIRQETRPKHGSDGNRSEVEDFATSASAKDSRIDNSAARTHHADAMNKEAMRGLYIGWGIAFALLVVAVAGVQIHGLFVFLRWFCFLAFAFSVVASVRLMRPVWAWVFAMEAVLFNPFVQIHLKRGLWQAIDWLALGSIGVAGIMFWKRLKETHR